MSDDEIQFKMIPEADLDERVFAESREIDPDFTYRCCEAWKTNDVSVIHNSTHLTRYYYLFYKGKHFKSICADVYHYDAEGMKKRHKYASPYEMRLVIGCNGEMRLFGHHIDYDSIEEAEADVIEQIGMFISETMRVANFISGKKPAWREG